MSSIRKPSSVRHVGVAFVATAFVFLLLDAAWLSTMASRLYRPAIGHIMRADFDVAAAALFYVIYVTGVVYFVVRPAASARAALAQGAFFGLVCYATYDLTNQATVIGWPWYVTFIDLAWGAFVTGTSACIAHRIAAPWRR